MLLTTVTHLIGDYGLKVAKKSKIGKNISEGIELGKNSSLIKFKGIESDRMQSFKSYIQNFITKAPEVVIEKMDDISFNKLLHKYIEKNGLTHINFNELTSKEKIIEVMLKKGGVGPCKFAQLLSSDTEILNKLSPELRTLLKKAQSENPFSRTADEADFIINKAFNPSLEPKTALAVVKPNAGIIHTRTFSTPKELSTKLNNQYEIIKPLSAGSVGESYLVLDKASNQQLVAKLIKKNVDTEQLEMEQQLLEQFIIEFAPNKLNANKHIETIRNLYKDWSKELDFSCEYQYNKMLQTGAKRYKVADITRISPDKSCILMEKASGIQMNELLKILKDYQKNPTGFQERYKDLIQENPWLQDPEKVIKTIPNSITKAFDEMFLFVNNKGNSVMHGDPHMGNFFITTNKEGNLIPMYIDTGNCIKRSAKEIQEDIKFLTDYFVGNSKGLAKYFLKQCNYDYARAAKCYNPNYILGNETNINEAFINMLSKEIHENIFGKRHNITNVDEVQKTIQVILEKYSLSMKPEAATALKAQMQFFTSIAESSALSGKVVDVGTIIKDIPSAILNLIKNRINPIYSVKDATNFAYNNQVLSTSCIYQFLKPATETVEIISKAKQPINELVKV